MLENAGFGRRVFCKSDVGSSLGPACIYSLQIMSATPGKPRQVIERAPFKNETVVETLRAMPVGPKRREEKESPDRNTRCTHAFYGFSICPLTICSLSPPPSKLYCFFHLCSTIRNRPKHWKRNQRKWSLRYYQCLRAPTNAKKRHPRISARNPAHL